MSNNADVCELRGHAYAGLVGIDTFALLETVMDFDEEDEGAESQTGTSGVVVSLDQFRKK